VQRIGEALPFHERTQADFAHETTPAETDNREIAPGHELVGEGSRDAEELSRLSDADDETALIVGLPEAGHMASWTWRCGSGSIADLVSETNFVSYLYRPSTGVAGH
jgi:hypothetical protein